MGVYYSSACHDCKEKVMWSKCTREGAEKRHKAYKRVHKNHDTQLSNDYDDDFEDRIFRYCSLGIR